MNNYTPKFLERFYSKINRTNNPNDCWLWTAAKTKGGYGQIGLNGKILYAHRVAFVITYGSIPSGLDVLHSCDTPACVNPNHLFPGTHTDNMQDCIRKGRKNYATGERHGACKLTDSQIAEVLQLHDTGTSRRDLSIRFGVSKSRIGQIVKNRGRNT